MHGVNLDLLHTGPHHADGRSKDPHAHHGAELRAGHSTARRQRWLSRIARLRSLFAHSPEPSAHRCHEQVP